MNCVRDPIARSNSKSVGSIGCTLIITCWRYIVESEGLIAVAAALVGFSERSTLKKRFSFDNSTLLALWNDGL